MRGFALVNVASGMENEFFQHLGLIYQVRDVFYLFGDYEFLVEVETDTQERLRDLLAKEIRHMPGVERAATFVEGMTSQFAPVSRAPVENPNETATIFQNAR